MAELLPRGASVRMNHRFRFNQEIGEASLPELVLHWDGDVAGAVEHRTHPFFIGLQGHPELGSDPALLNLWLAFVRAALEKRNVGDFP